MSLGLDGWPFETANYIIYQVHKFQYPENPGK
jgi:hypothetical protein